MLYYKFYFDSGIEKVEKGHSYPEILSKVIKDMEGDNLRAWFRLFTKKDYNAALKQINNK